MTGSVVDVVDVTAIAEEAGRRARGWFERRGDLVVETKAAQDYVSQADRDVESSIRAAVAAKYPGHAFLGEEGGRTDAADAPALWIVDPIDGTTNFVRGIPFWAVSIAVAVDGVVRTAVVHDPLRGETFAATLGGGTTLNGAKLTVSPTDDPLRALIACGHNRTADHARFQAANTELLAHGYDVRRLGSAALATSYVAAGRVDAFWELKLSPWDVAASGLLVREAGGTTNDYGGATGWRGSHPWLASNAAFYSRLSRITGIA